MTRRTCPHCARRVPVTYEGAAIAADASLVAVFAEHDPCPGSYQPVDAPRELPAPPKPRRARTPKPPPVQPLERKHHPRARQLLDLLGQGPATVGELAGRLEVPPTTVRASLQRLRHRGLVQGEGRPQVWRVAL